MGLKTHKPHVKTSTRALSLLTQRPRSEASPLHCSCSAPAHCGGVPGMRPSPPGSHVIIPWFLFVNIMMGRGPPQRKWRSHSTRSPGHTQRGTQPLLQTCWDLCPELIKKEPGSFRIQKLPSFQVSNSPLFLRTTLVRSHQSRSQRNT